MSRPNNLFLVGPMGVGKTTIGKLLAKELAMLFYDSDHEIEQRTGADIPLIFEMEGEQGFRSRETKVLAALVKLNNIVLATGGGAVTRAENRKMLTEHGFIIYLSATPKKLYNRIISNRQRPLLEGEDKLAKINTLLIAREPLYRALADKVVATDGLTTKQIIATIIQAIA